MPWKFKQFYLKRILQILIIFFKLFDHFLNLWTYILPTVELSLKLVKVCGENMEWMFLSFLYMSWPVDHTALTKIFRLICIGIKMLAKVLTLCQWHKLDKNLTYCILIHLQLCGSKCVSEFFFTWTLQLTTRNIYWTFVLSCFFLILSSKWKHKFYYCNENFS